MKKTLQNSASGFAGQMETINQSFFRFLAALALMLVLFSSCNSDNESRDNEATLACKKKPGKISFRDGSTDIVYNMQDMPIEITTSEYNIAAPAEPPVITVYTIDYNAQGKAAKVSKSVDNQLELYYELEYNSEGKLIKQSQFNGQGALVTSTDAHYDDSGILTGITTRKEGTSVEVTSNYQYLDGNLVKKSIQNLYDLNSQEYYSADYTYTYFPDRENKVKPYFEGPLGLLFVSNMSDEQSLQYVPDSGTYQLFIARETPSEKNMLKNVEIIAHRYTTRDTAKIDYSYEYDADGYPTVQRGTYKNVIRRYVPNPFGGSDLIVSPVNNSFESTMTFSCN